MPLLPVGRIREYSAHDAGPPVLMAGDILGGYASWAPHAALLSPHYRFIALSPLVVACAAAGDRPPEPWSLDVEGEALAAVLDSLELDDAHVGGWSLGGSVALAFAMSHPGRVRSLTLVEPQARWALRAAGRHADADADVAFMRAYAAMDDVDEEALAAFFRHAGVAEADARPQDSRAWPLAWVHRNALRYAARVAEHKEDASRLAAVSAPTLVADTLAALLPNAQLLTRGGRKTGSFRARSAASSRDRLVTDTLAALLPNAQLLTLPGGHASHLTDIDAFVRAFRRLVAEAEAR